MFDRYGPIGQVVEDILPAHMMSLALDRLYAEGFEVRLDTRGYLNNSMLKSLKKCPGQELVIAHKADDAARAIMNHVGFDDAVTAVVAISLLLVKLVDENLYLDPSNQAILSALQIVADTREDENPDTANTLRVAEAKAGRMLDECLRAGWYNHAKLPN